MPGITRTDEEIKTELDKLIAMKPTVRHYSHFGDDNWARMEVQIECLQKRRDISDDIDEDNATRDLYHCARDAWSWLCGEAVDDMEDGLAASWAGLVQ
jgi:hypothetical protein